MSGGWRWTARATSPRQATCSTETTRWPCRRAASCCSSRRSNRPGAPARGARRARASRPPCSTAWRARPGSRRIGGTRPAASTRCPMARRPPCWPAWACPLRAWPMPREALEQFADERDRRALPCAVAGLRERGDFAAGRRARARRRCDGRHRRRARRRTSRQEADRRRSRSPSNSPRARRARAWTDVRSGPPASSSHPCLPGATRSGLRPTRTRCAG